MPPPHSRRNHPRILEPIDSASPRASKGKSRSDRHGSDRRRGGGDRGRRRHRTPSPVYSSYSYSYSVSPPPRAAPAVIVSHRPRRDRDDPGSDRKGGGKKHRDDRRGDRDDRRSGGDGHKRSARKSNHSRDPDASVSKASRSPRRHDDASPSSGQPKSSRRRDGHGGGSSTRQTLAPQDAHTPRGGGGGGGPSPRTSPRTSPRVSPRGSPTRGEPTPPSHGRPNGAVNSPRRGHAGHDLSRGPGGASGSKGGADAGRSPQTNGAPGRGAPPKHLQSRVKLLNPRAAKDASAGGNVSDPSARARLTQSTKAKLARDSSIRRGGRGGGSLRSGQRVAPGGHDSNGNPVPVVAVLSSITGLNKALREEVRGVAFKFLASTAGFVDKKTVSVNRGNLDASFSRDTQKSNKNLLSANREKSSLMTESKAKTSAALHDPKLAAEIEKAFTTADIILGDSALIAPYLRHARRARWVQTVNDIEPILRQRAIDRQAVLDQQARDAELRAAFAKKQHEVSKRKAKMMEHLADVQPLLDIAQSKVNSISQRALDEVKSLNSPPQPVKLCLEAVMLALGEWRGVQRLAWERIRKVVKGQTFISTILNYDIDKMSTQARDVLEQRYIPDPAFTFHTIDKASNACGPLYEWVVSLIEYSKVYDKVRPLRAKIKQMEAELGDMENQIKELELLASLVGAAPPYTLTRLGDISAQRIAEYAFTYILGHEKQYTNQGGYRALATLTMGIITSDDDTPQALISVARAFRMRIICLNVEGNQIKGTSAAFRPQQVAPFLKQCDYVVSVASRVKALSGLLNGKVLSSAKPQSLLILPLAPVVVAEKSLLHALSERWIHGAVLDNFYPATDPTQPPWVQLPNAVITPSVTTSHVVAQDVLKVFTANLEQFLASQALKFAVKLEWVNPKEKPDVTEKTTESRSRPRGGRRR